MNTRSWSARYLPNLNVIELRFMGVVSASDLMLAYQRCGDLSSQHQCFRFLTDCSAVTYGFDVGDLATILHRLDLGEHKSAYREAVILPFSHVAQHSLQLWEMACRSEELTVHCFHDAEIAIPWLLSED